MDFLQQLIGLVQDLPLAAIWGVAFGILLLCGFGVPIPEDITLVLVGYMTFKKVGLASDQAALAVIVGLAGVLIGDGTMFTLGQRLGSRLVGVWPFRSILGGGRLEATRSFLASHGPKVLFTARFTPGLRSVVFFTSGTLGTPLKTFLFYDGIAALLSVPALVLSSWYWGAQIDQVIEHAKRAEHGILIVIVVVAALLTLKWWLGHRKKQRAALLAKASELPPDAAQLVAQQPE